MAKLIY